MENKDEITLGEGFGKFINFKKARNLSPATIEYYQNNYSFLMKYIDAETKCTDIDSDTIDEYVEYMMEELNVAEQTVNTRLRFVRCFFYYLMKYGYMDSFEILLIRAGEQLVEIYTDEDIEALIKKPDTDDCSFSQYRNWVMVCHFLSTGNRLTTVRNLKNGDVNIEDHEVVLRKVKNKKPYVMPLSNSYCEILSEYMSVRGGDDDDYLFPNAYGEQLAEKSLQDGIKSHNISRGVHKRKIVHLFRHTFATKWIVNGGDIFRLQKVLGHTTLEMVKKYVTLASNDLKTDLDTYNPFEIANQNVQPKKALLIQRDKAKRS